ncbi:hypothetical protein DY138_01450 [Apilactobacillus timberlakei]|uniref:hypothetical protein n=1 Tax=Apilactobacillus TaxID=2767877 RepID=UPI000D01C1BB|nr:MULTISPECIES: hypothetical protein [Apilactobacillus]TPR20133.1 hypothetical protein DY138_01450 [Apilactobacillus timberlakei]TPR20446.1 hypothetical protein DY083_08275 [Apilactobacillus timberlakei]TPR21851.1 hypothetical protein DY061_01365 [Apilactobacillus timberlakei]
MKNKIMIGKYIFNYDEENTPVVTNEDKTILVFLDEDYAEVLMKVELAQNKLSITPTESMEEDDVQLNKINELEYTIYVAEE